MSTIYLIFVCHFLSLDKQLPNLGSQDKKFFVAPWASNKMYGVEDTKTRNNELFFPSLFLHFPTKKSVPNFRAKNHDATARDVRHQCRRRRLSHSERRRCPHGTRRPAGVARCAFLVLSFFFSFLFRVKNLWGEFWLRFVSRGYFFARCGGGRCG